MSDEHVSVSKFRRCTCGWESPFRRQPLRDDVMRREFEAHLAQLDVPTARAVHRSAVRLAIRREEKLP